MNHPGDPFAQLMQEHTTVLVHLKHLHKTADAIRREGYTSRHARQYHSALRFIEEEVRVHNRREEHALFPLLERYVEGPTRLMRTDHKKLHRWFRSLAKAVGRVDGHPDSFSAIQHLAGITQEGIQLFVNHIHKENYILFPLVRKFLSKEEIREIASKMI